MKITVVIPCYNSMSYLDQCITSVLNQDYEDYEVWACDNESDDGTYEYLLDLEKKHESLKVFQLPNIHPNGYQEAVKYVIENTESDYVTFVASDDFIESNYITNCMKVISHNPEKIKCIQSGFKGVTNGQIVNQQIHFYKNIKEFKQQCMVRSPVNTPTVIYHRSLFPLLLERKAHVAAAHPEIGAGDYDMYCCLADNGIFIYPVPQSLGYYYRWHEDQCTWIVQKQRGDVDYDKIIQDFWKNKWNL